MNLSNPLFKVIYNNGHHFIMLPYRDKHDIFGTTVQLVIAKEAPCGVMPPLDCGGWCSKYRQLCPRIPFSNPFLNLCLRRDIELVQELLYSL